jgi:hypothetical protein
LAVATPAVFNGAVATPAVFRIAAPVRCADGEHVFPDPRDSRCFRCAATREVNETWAEFSARMADERAAAA